MGRVKPENLIDVTRFFSEPISTTGRIEGINNFIIMFYPNKIFLNEHGKKAILLKDLVEIENEYQKYLENNKRKEGKRDET